MAILLVLIGVVIGILISGVIFTLIVYKSDENPSIKAMHDYIHQLEEENENLKERNARLRENIVRNNYD